MLALLCQVLCPELGCHIPDKIGNAIVLHHCEHDTTCPRCAAQYRQRRFCVYPASLVEVQLHSSYPKG